MEYFLLCINWGDALTDIVSSLIVTLITAGVGALFIKHYLARITFSNKMKEMGFSNTSTNKQSQKEISQMCDKAKEIKIIYVSGFHFMNINKHHLERALKRGATVKFLCAHPDSVFLKDIENMEYFQRDLQGKRLREKESKIGTEVMDMIEKYRDTKLEMRFYSSEYRLPFILAYYPDESVKAWLTVTLPPYKSSKSFLLRGEKKKNPIPDDEFNFIDMMETNFDMIWEHASKSVEEVLEDHKTREEALKEHWDGLYRVAKQNTEDAKEHKGALIEVAAQHPLIDGTTPNEEFQKRLLKAVDLYHELKDRKKPVKIYVPGSVHKDNGVVDKLSLSEAGKRFLVKKGIPKSDIYADDMNEKYKGKDGVYNSTEECYVACKIFSDNSFGELHCICSPAQMTRKVFSYIHCGYVPDVHTVSCDEMYHNYVKEVFENVPELLSDMHILQDDWNGAVKSRNSRKPTKD